MMLSCAYFTDRLDKPTLQGAPIDDAFMTRNFELCRAVNITSLGVVLDKMIEAGLPKEQAECFRANAYSLLQLMRTENNRLRADAHEKRQNAG